MDIRRKVLGEEHPDTARAYNDLAVNLEDQRRHADAERLFQKALEIFRKVVGEDHPDTAAAYANLAITLYASAGYRRPSPTGRPRPRASSEAGER